MLLAFALAWTILSWPWLSGAVTIPWDAKAHFQAQLQFLASSLHSGQWPFWNPYVFAGTPQIADPQSLIFSPPYLLLALLEPTPSFQQADGVAFGMLGLGAIAIILLFRDRGWHWTGALVGALAFAFGGSAAWRIQHTGQILSLAWLAIALMLLDRALRQNAASWGLAAGLAAGLMVLGRDQVAWLGVWLLAGIVVSWLLSFEGDASPQTSAPGSNPRPLGREGFHADEPLPPMLLPRQASRFGMFRSALRRSLRPLGAGLLGGVAVVAMPLIWTILLAGDSNRPFIDLAGAERGSLHPSALLTLWSANLFGTDGPLTQFWGPPSLIWGPVDLYLARNMSNLYAGALVPILLLLGLFSGTFRDREIRLFSIALVAVLLYALGRYTPVFGWMFTLMPGADLFRRPADATFIIGFLFAILAGYVTGRLADGSLRPGRATLWATACALIAGFAAAFALAAAKDQLSFAAPQLLRAMAWTALGVLLLAFLISKGRIWPGLATAALLVGMTADLMRENRPNESTALPPSIYEALRPDTGNETIAVLRRELARHSAPDRRDRIELAGIDFHWPNASMIHGLDHTLGYNPIRLWHYSAATGAQDHVALPEQRSFSPLFASYRSPLADLLGLRLIVTRVPVEERDANLIPGDLTLIARTDDGFIYDNRRAMPRVFVVEKAMKADFAAMIAGAGWPDFDPGEAVLLEEPGQPLQSANGTSGTAQARILDYRNTQIRVAVDAPRGGWLVLADAWHPWWQADIDGKPVAVLRANVAIRAVRLPPGQHTVRFTFRPFRGALAQIMRQLRWR